MIQRSNPLASGPGYDLGIEWEDSTGAITGIWCNNSGPYIIDCTATLTNGVSFTTGFGIAQGQLLAVPGSAVTVSMGGDGELVFLGLQSTSVTGHLA
jgi:hypothetical protein